MTAAPRTPVVIACAFVECINRQDLDGLTGLMSDDHRLEVFDETPLAGRAANADAWRGYFERFPRYVIHPHQLVEREDTVAILGHTTGSHLGLPDDEEAGLTLIWLAEVSGPTIRRWKLVEDNPESRGLLGFPEPDPDHSP